MKLAPLLVAPAALFPTDLAHAQTVRTVDPAAASTKSIPAAAGPVATVSTVPVSAAAASAATARAQSRAAGTRPYVLLTGYWPPTNEAVRHFSPQPSLNPVWEGSDWRGRGYDVVSFFPTFASPNCSSCGTGFGDLIVDYQATTDDFARIVDAYEPIAIITFSRGFINMSWEVEANQYNRTSWINDFIPPRQPDASPPDPTVDAGAIRHSTLPVESIVERIAGSGLPVVPNVCYSADGGGFLSEYIAYLGVTHQANHADPAQPDWCVAAGHVHVGGLVPWGVASDAVDETLEAVLDYVDGVLAAPPIQPFCPGNANSAYSEAVLTPIGDPSISTGGLSFLAQRTTPNQAGLLFYGPGAASPTPLGDGLLCVQGPLYRLPVVSGDTRGILELDLDYVNGPLSVGPGAAMPGATFAFQAWFRDPFGALGSNTTTAALVTFTL